MSRRAKMLSGIALLLASLAILALPLSVLLVPLASRYYTVGLSVDLHGLQILVATGIAGGAGLVGAIWLITDGKKGV